MLLKNEQITHVLANNSMLKWWTEKSTELASSRITSEASWFVSNGFPTVQLMTPSLGVQKYYNVKFQRLP